MENLSKSLVMLTAYDANGLYYPRSRRERKFVRRHNYFALSYYDADRLLRCGKRAMDIVMTGNLVSLTR